MQILPKYAFAITATLAFVTVSTSRAQVSGVNAAFSPVGQRIFFSEDSGLTDGFLYGGDFGFRFGQFLELGGNYFFGNRLETDFSHFTPGLLTDNVMDKTAALEALGELETREVRLRRYGGKLRINVGHGRVFPFLSTGTGILRFNPDGVSASDYIYAQAGVGLTLGVSERYSASVSVENLSYRYNPATTFLNDDELVTAELSREDFRRATVHNWGLSASLHMNLGARASDWLTYFDRALLSQYRGGYFRLVVEPFYGQINFNDGLAFPASRAIGGINAGVDLGPYIGLRGFYWRDTDQEGIFEEGLPNKLGDVEFYGGELNLRFNSQFGARNFTPYLIVGGGYMNVTAGSGFVDLHGIVPESRYFAMGGGGMELSLTSVIKLQGSLRSVLMSPGAIEDVSTPGNVLGSLMYTAGFNFNIGSRGRTLGSSIQRQLAAERAKNQVLAKAMEVELARIQARLDSLEATPAGWQTSEADSAETRTAEVTLSMQGDSISRPIPIPSRLSGQTLMIPVPMEGELHISFGNVPAATPGEAALAPPVIVVMPHARPLLPADQPIVPSKQANLQAEGDSVVALPGGLTVTQIQQIVSEALAEQQPQQGLTDDELDEWLRRMESRIQREIARVSEEIRDDVSDRTPDVPVVVSDSSARRGIMASIRQRRRVAVLPLIGIRLGSGPEQLLIGARADYRFYGRKVRFLPEAVIGVGPSIAFEVLGNLAWDFSFVGPLRPYAGPGIGFISDRGLAGLEFAVNLLVGAEYSTRKGTTFFGEYNAVNFFDVHRVIVGYRLRL